MRTRSIALAVVVVALVAASVASAQTSRYIGLGGGIALTRDAAAVDLNPAALGALEVGAKAPGQFQFEIAGTFEVAGDQDVWAVNLAGGPAQAGWGFGASYFDASPGSYDYDGWNFGVGKQVDENVFVGAAINKYDYMDDDETSYTLGALFVGDRIDWGFVINDVTDQTTGLVYNAGAAADLAPGWTAIFDAWDITDQFDQSFSLGVEFTPKGNLAFRAGMFEGGNFSAGVGFKADRFAIDIAYAQADDDADADDSIFVTASTNL